jgi:hypothetical protein
MDNEQILIGLLLLVILYLLWNNGTEHAKGNGPRANPVIGYDTANIFINNAINLKNMINTRTFQFKLRPQDVERINAVPSSIVVTDFNNRLSQITVPDDVQQRFYDLKDSSIQRIPEGPLQLLRIKEIIQALPNIRLDPSTKYRLYSALYIYMLANYLQVQNVLNLNPAPVIVARPK